MALHLQVSNSLSQLALHLCRDLQAQDRGVFQSDYIVTQTEGMNSWLKLQLAEHLGIAANYQFIKPNDLIHQVYKILGGQYLQPLSPENQCWLLYKLLAEKEFTEKYKTVAAYFTEAGPESDLKRMALAEKVADLFDQYQIYRHDMIHQWNDDFVSNLGTEDWQKYLWLKAKKLSYDRLPDKTSVGRFIQQALKDPAQQQRLKHVMPAVHVFGLSVTTAFHIELFHQIGLYTEISFLLLNPAPATYWFDDRSEKHIALLKKRGLADYSETSAGNTLLTSWGKVIQNTFSLLFQNDELLNRYEVVDQDEPEPDSLLHKIQEDICLNRDSTERNLLSAEDLSDGSVLINSCFTPAREVEVLYNYLVHLVDQRKETLSARDVVVMVSDIDTYAPYIKAVFDNAPHKIPYSIADESFTANDTVMSALRSVLLMNAQNFKAEDVLQLLDSGFIRQRFALNDLSLLRKVVDRANIRFGMEGRKEDDSMYVSWHYGLKRIMYGICISGEEEYFEGDESLYPLDLVEGSASWELIRFCHFIEVLMDSIRERSKPRTLSEWGLYIEKVLNNLVFDPAGESNEDYVMLLKQLEKYNLLNALLTEPISYEVFCHSFLQSLGGAVRSGTFASGGVTFCSLIPMRSIPFKVVALLGLNFDKFPRKENPVSFDKMAKEKRKGDRNVKENDKHLFLETLLSAEQYLYISYIGQSTKDSTIIPPSALVDELIDYIQSNYVGKQNFYEKLIIRHPLHGFSKKYRNASSGLYTYLDQLLKENLPDILVEKKEQRLELKEVSLDSLISFFKNPVKGYFNNVLSINYESDNVLLSDTELFETDSLQNWAIKQALLPLDTQEVPVLKDRLLKTGMLPLKNMADVILEREEAEVSPVRELLFNCVGNAEAKNIPLNLEFESQGLTLSGSMKHIYDNRLVMICWSKSDKKYLIEAYIRFLAARSTGLAVDLYFISAKKQQIFQAIGIAREDARNRLSSLLDLYKDGHRLVLPFWSDFPFKPGDIPALTAAKFRSQLKDKLTNYQYPCDDLYIMNKYYEGYFEDDSAFDLFMQCAAQLILPLGELFPEYYD